MGRQAVQEEGFGYCVQVISVRWILARQRNCP
ncbi:hypothetical protein SpCBS45565_g00185 [Spizellomyces sp. 'palustris']|nr:hypothetical protein SpCBS45565_g00185 [Spizellomyces sp. 'palustris']